MRVVTDETGSPQWSVGSKDEPTRVLIEIDSPDWQGYVFRLSYAGDELIDLSLSRDERADVLTAHQLQRVPLGALDRFARQWVAEFLAAWDEANPSGLISRFPDSRDWLDPIAHPAEPSDVQAAQLCQRYLELTTNPAWRQILADEFGKQPSSIPTLVMRARRRRFLTHVPRGQMGGRLTPKAMRLLAPPERQSAWDKATEEQRAGAMAREALRERAEADLVKQHRDGETDAATYQARLLALDVLVMGWNPEEIHPDEPSNSLRAAVRYLRNEYEELSE